MVHHLRLQGQFQCAALLSRSFYSNDTVTLYSANITLILRRLCPKIWY